MRTCLLMLYVTLEQEDAIKQLYLQKGWNWFTTACISHIKQNDMATQPQCCIRSLEDIPDSTERKYDGCQRHSSYLTSDRQRKYEEVEGHYPDISSERLDGVVSMKDGKCIEYLSETKASLVMPRNTCFIQKMESGAVCCKTTADTSCKTTTSSEVSCNNPDLETDDPSVSRSRLLQEVCGPATHNDNTLLEDVYENDEMEDETDVSFLENYESAVTVPKNSCVANSSEIGHNFASKKVQAIARAKKIRKGFENYKEIQHRSSYEKENNVRKSKHFRSSADDVRNYNKSTSSDAKKAENEPVSDERSILQNQFIETVTSNSRTVESVQKTSGVKTLKKMVSSKLQEQRKLQNQEIVCESVDAKLEHLYRPDPLMYKSDTSCSDTPTHAKNPDEQYVTHEHRKYTCEYCNRVFLKKSHFKKHTDKHRKHAFDCLDCGKSFGNRRNLNSHKYTRKKVGKFTCDMCNFETTTACLLRIHKKDTHQSPGGKYLCHLCAKEVMSKSYLNLHLKYVHKINEGKYECPICGLRCKRPKLFTKHLKEHNNAQDTIKLQCSECSKVFPTRRQLRNHMRYHREKSHICSICGKGFTTPSKLKSHQLTHTGVKPFTCSLCDYKSNQKGNLRLHMRVHQKQLKGNCNPSANTEDPCLQMDCNFLPTSLFPSTSISPPTLISPQNLEFPPTSISHQSLHQQVSNQAEKQLEDTARGENLSVSQNMGEVLGNMNKDNKSMLPIHAEYIATKIVPTRSLTSICATDYTVNQKPKTQPLFTPVQTLVGVQSNFSVLSANESKPLYTNTEKSNKQAQVSAYLTLQNADNLVKVETLKAPTSFPKLSDSSKSGRHPNSDQTLYAADHAEPAPSHVLSKANSNRAKACAPTLHMSQLSSSPLYTNTQMTEYSEATSLHPSHSASSIYGITGEVIRGTGPTSVVQPVFNSSQLITENITNGTIKTAKASWKKSRKNANCKRAAVNSKLVQTAEVKDNGEPRVDFTSVTSLLNERPKESIQTDSDRQTEESNVFKQKYIHVNLLNEIYDVNEVKKYPDLYLETSRASFTDLELHTSTVETSNDVFHDGEKMNLTRAHQKSYAVNRDNKGYFTGSRDPMLNDRAQPDIEITDQLKTSYTGLQSPQYTSI